MKNVVILGSTGSIGTQTLNVIGRNTDKFRVLAVVAGSNAEKLSEQANLFHPEYVGLFDINAVKNQNLNYAPEIYAGEDVSARFAALEKADIVVVAITGMNAFDGVISAILHQKAVALASKEVLVSGGEFVMNLARQNNVDVLPVDSEHSAVWQCLEGKKSSDVDKIILTASGGPFYNVHSVEELKNVTPEQAVRHPNWNMGKKISVDSATMMNKGLELIEASHLFGTPNVDYIVHPQSIIHSMVRFIDGSTLAQISAPTMELPIQLALSYPERIKTKGFEFNFDKQLTFLPPKEDIFVLPKLAKQCLKTGLGAPCVLNAANEAAVQLFLDGKIGFADIQNIVSEVLQRESIVKLDDCAKIKAEHFKIYDKVLADYKVILSAFI